MIVGNRLLRFGGPGAPLVCGALYLGLVMSSVVWAQQSDWQVSAEDRVPAQGEPPLTQVAVDRLIGFFEWALDIRFTRAERAEFQRKRIAEWRSSDAESVKNVATILEIEGRLQSLDVDRRRQAQVEIQGNLLAELSKNPNDETSRLLLAARRRSRGANSGGANGAAGDKTDRAARGGVPAELVGTWLIGSTSGTTLRDRTTGTLPALSGDQVSYRILPDGRYEYAGRATQSMYNCTTRLMTYLTGRVSVRGAALTFTPETGKFTSEDNCNRKYNYEKRLPLTSETYNWRIERDHRGLKLDHENDLLPQSGERRCLNERGSQTALLVAHAMAPLTRGFHFSTVENPARSIFTEREHVIVVSGARVASIIPAFFIGEGGKR